MDENRQKYYNSIMVAKRQKYTTTALWMQTGENTTTA